MELERDLDGSSNQSGAKQQGLRYLIVGGSTALFENLLFNVFFRVLNISLSVSNVAATTLATIANFGLNRTVTFQSTSNPVRSMLLYIALLIFNMWISTLGIDALLNIGVSSFIAKAAMQACVVVWNFIIYRNLIFK